MSMSDLVRRMRARAWVRPEALNVTPDLLGMPLAPHGRRVGAMGVDLAVVGILSSTGVFWVVAGIAALARQLMQFTPGRGRGRTALMWLTLALLVAIAGQRAVDYVQHRGDPVSAQARDDDDDDDSPAARRAAAAPASGQAQSAARIAALEAELAEARKPVPLRWRDDALKAWHRLGRGFGWAIAYFTLLPFWWRGRTLGKWLFGLRIVELTGKPLGLLTCFGRYGGYAAGLATGGMGFLQILWDPNRQAVQDKLAHTVVVDLRAPRAIAGDAPSAVPAPTPGPA
jgi:uncharacterized RDD family membrane protein YckC